MEPYSPKSRLPFPFNLVSRIWHRIWYGLLCFSEPDCSSTPSSPRLGPTRFPLTPTPCSSSDNSDKTRNSSPIFREVSYTAISSLLDRDVDYLRRPINRDGFSQNRERHSLHVMNPDIYAQSSHTNSPPDSLHSNLRRRSSPPRFPRFPFTNPYPPLTPSVDREELLSSLFSNIIVDNVTDEEPSFSTTDEDLWDYLERCRLRPLPLFTRSRLSQRSGLTRALGLFMSSDASLSATDASGMEDSTDSTEMHRSNSPDAIPPASQSRRTSTSRRRSSGIIHAMSSMFKRRFSQIDDEIATSSAPSASAPSPPTPSSSTPSPSYSSSTSLSRRSIERRGRWSRETSTSSYRRSSSSGWSFMPNFPGRRSCIYGSEKDYLEVSLAAGLAAQERRATGKEGEGLG
ncbi:hypothetical protein N7493_008492 [Penicillium malachiteum]|uniref:Uncharacterized protein n=1 Tax=Penicillium malachiteum TaxID=1324776 RepID=A0AAD6HH84_9EURO|nr:hypothetical protein N7493_008492 [Penicillium malachiteum]